MDGLVARVGLISVLALGACVGTPPDPLARAVIHGAETGDTIGGSAVDRVREATGLPVSESPTWWISRGDEAVPASDLGYAAVLEESGVRLWRRRDPVAAATVAVDPEPLPAMEGQPEGSPVRGFEQYGAVSPGGELVGTLYLQPPARMPPRPCLSLELDEATLDLGELLMGRGSFVPGAGPRPTFAHRIYRPMPKDWPVGTYDVAVQLHTCDTRRPLAPPSPISLVVVASGLPSVDDLSARPWVADSSATWTELRGRKEAIHRGPDGSLEVRPAPPLPRVLRGDAFGWVIGGPVDPSAWPIPDGTVGPLDGISGVFREADAATLSVDAVAARGGESLDNVVPRRVVPEQLTHIAELDVQGVIFSSHGLDGGGVGLDESAGHANRLGLRSGGRQVDLDIGSGDNAVSATLIHASGANLATLGEVVSAARARVGDALLVVEVVDAVSPEAAARTLYESGADGGYVVGDALGPVWLRDGVPVLLGVPGLDEAHRQSVLMRWYVAPHGITRVDLQSVVLAGSRWNLDREARGRPALLAASQGSAAYGAWLAVGQTMAGIDVLAHGPDRVRDPAVPRQLPQLETGELDPPTLPARCVGTLPADADAAAKDAGAGLSLVDARVIDDTGPVIEAELWWRADGPLPPGRVAWYVDGLSAPWRASSVPCGGSWDFDKFQPGQLVRDRVRLRAPDDVETGTGRLWMDLRLGDERRPIGGERRIEVGEIRVP